jgi:hypothetical protein
MMVLLFLSLTDQIINFFWTYLKGIPNQEFWCIFMEQFCPLIFSMLRSKDKIMWAYHVEYQKLNSSFTLEYAGENTCLCAVLFLLWLNIIKIERIET